MHLAVRIVRYAEMSLSVDIVVDECWDIETKVRYLRSMSEALQIEFQKWEGTGNTFVIIDGFKYAGFDLQSLDRSFARIAFRDMQLSRWGSLVFEEANYKYVFILFVNNPH